jgi:hypothetical protein
MILPVESVRSQSAAVDPSAFSCSVLGSHVAFVTDTELFPFSVDPITSRATWLAGSIVGLGGGDETGLGGGDETGLEAGDETGLEAGDETGLWEQSARLVTTMPDAHGTKGVVGLLINFRPIAPPPSTATTITAASVTRRLNLNGTRGWIGAFGGSMDFSPNSAAPRATAVVGSP